MSTRPKWLPALSCLSLVSTIAGADPSKPAEKQPISSQTILQGIHFKTDVGTVLQALARRANAGIVIADDVKGMVTVDLNRATIEEAIRLVTAQAKVAYRRIGNVFVVAPVDTMKRVLEQYLAGQEERFALRNIPAATAVTQLTEAVPFVTARAAGKSVLLLGAPDDLTRARTLLAEIDTITVGDPSDNAAISLTYVPAADIQKVIAGSFPTLKAQAVGETSVSIVGPRGDVERARQLIRELDKGKDANARWLVYQVKYASPSALTQSLQQTVKNLTVVTGPQSYYIPPAQLQLSSAQTLGNSSGNSGSGGGIGGSSGGGFGGSGGSSSSGGGGGIGSSSGSGSGSQGSGGFGGGNQSGSGSQGGAGERSRSIILGGTDDAVKAALKLLESLDIPTPQVVLDVKVVSSSPLASSSLGIDWSNGGQGGAASISTTFTEGATAAGVPTIINPTNGLGAFGRLPISFSAALNAFLRRDDVKIMAKPTITALDNEPGVVFVGETRRVSVSSIAGNGGGASNIILNNVVEIPVGIILQMRPRINEGDQITLQVHPIYSTVSGVDARTGLFNTAQREANTTVRIKSGETLVIGGLLQEEDTKTLIKVPILGDIPLIGQFFRNTSRTQLRREVLVFVTPHLVKD